MVRSAIWHDPVAKGWNWTSKDSRSMYVKATENIAAAAVISSSILAAIVSNGARPHAVVISVRCCVVCLLSSVVFAIVTIISLTRGYERARSRFLETPQGKVASFQEQGQLKDVELCLTLSAGYLCLVGFFLGFLFLGRIVF